MLTNQQKQEIAKGVEKAIRNIHHPEIDSKHIRFQLFLQGRFDWSYAHIHQNEPKKKDEPNHYSEESKKRGIVYSQEQKDILVGLILREQEEVKKVMEQEYEVNLTARYKRRLEVLEELLKSL